MTSENVEARRVFFINLINFRFSLILLIFINLINLMTRRSQEQALSK